MKPIEIIPYKVLVHQATGATISAFSVLPFGTFDDWKFEQRGWTTLNDNGTTGCGQRPFKTLDEAKAKHPDLPTRA